MLSKFKFFFYSIMVSAALAACSGEDGDPGPQGEQGEKGPQGEQGPQGNPGIGAAYKTGSVEGTVAGKRKDGTAFSETFKYEYTFNNVQAFYQDDGETLFDVSRYLDPTGNGPSMFMELKQVSEGVLEPSSTSYSINFDFQKELNNDDLFVIDVQPFFEATEGFVLELSEEENNTYNFSTSSGGLYYQTDTYNGTAAYRFSAYTNNDNYEVYYGQATGALLGLYDYQTGNNITSGALFNLYNKLKFIMNATLGQPVFYNVANNAPLFTEYPDVPADQFTITNYARNASTGVITFDFVLKVSGYLSSSQRRNSTGHDLTITGKFNSGGKVYKNIVARTQG
jgi:hypothetical protein